MYDDDKRYFNDDDSPKRCTNCESTGFITTVIAIDGGHISEIAVRCSSCDKRLGYRAYGNYDPCFLMNFLDMVRS